MAESDDEDFAALFAASEGKRPRERRVAAGDVVRGRVIAVGGTAAFVAVGGKAEATIELGEFRDPATGEVQLHEGDEIEATVVDDGGVVVAGAVTSLGDLGAFVGLGGVDGLIHVSELGYGRASHPSDVLQVGQRVEAQVVKLEPDPKGGRGRVGLSLRALAPDPWATAAERFPVGASVCGTVRRLEQFGAFVELTPGIDGLVHVSRLALDRRVSHPRQIVSIGDIVDVTVVELDLAKRRIGLSMIERAKQAKEGAEAEERRDTEKVLARSSEKPSLGTLADLLGKSPKSKR